MIKLGTDLKLFVLPAVVGVIAVPSMDLVWRFVIPILSGFTWWILKRILIWLENKIKSKF